MSRPDIVDICATLDGLQRQRKFYIKLHNQQVNAAGGLVRQVMRVPHEPTDTVSADDIDRMKAVALKIVAGDRPDGWSHIVDQVQGPIAALRMAVEPLEKARGAVELEMRKVARKLPVAAWANDVKGFGELALAVVVAEAGDLSRYANEGKLWKRLGLAPYNGRAMSNWKSEFGRMGDAALTSKEWTDAKYAPRRRAEIYSCVGDPLSKHQLESVKKSGAPYGRPKGPYGEVYVRRREHTALTHPEMPMKNKKNPPEPHWTKGHQRGDAVRVMTKSLISDLWSEWRRARVKLSKKTKAVVPAAEHLQAAE